MKKLATTMAAAATVALTALIAAGPADAASPRHHDQVESYGARHSGPGYYEGQYEYHVDRDDRASSPYAGGGY
jgi:hypothetical protein